MRPTDKFCAICGTAAAPRPAKTRAAAPAPPEPPTPVRAPQSTAEAFHAPLPATSTNAANLKQPELGFSAPPRPPRPGPAAPVNPAAAPQVQMRQSAQQEEQEVLLQAEEIASVRGMLPVDALPEDFPAPAAPPATRAAAGQSCAYCGGRNPASNKFCESCGRPLQDATTQSAPARAPVRPVPPPVVQSSWLDVPEPVAAAASAEPKPRAISKTAAPVAPPASPASTGKEEPFFYIYDDTAAQRGHGRLLIVLLVVLALGVLGVIYLLSRSPAKTAAGANVTVTISPTEAQVAAGQAQDFSATVTGSGDTDVSWSIAEGSTGGKVVNHGAQAEGGTVTTQAVYVAPTTPGTYHVIATSHADQSKSATAEVTVSGK